MGDSSKYNFDMDYTPTGTHKLILDNVPNGSTVLECGCASGYMTKYMNQKLNCTVDIIEIDEDCYAKAREFARDGVCCDLEDRDDWYIYFRTIAKREYYRILFADVLEHLHDPLSVIKDAANLLHPNGKMIISIPNICHNDILIKMFYDRFDYTPLGLLDNTHIHFFGLNNIPKFLTEAGLKLDKVHFVTAPMGCTEQRIAGADSRLIELLKERNLGDVYQFVFVCKKDV